MDISDIEISDIDDVCRPIQIISDKPLAEHCRFYYEYQDEKRTGYVISISPDKEYLAVIFDVRGCLGQFKILKHLSQNWYEPQNIELDIQASSMMMLWLGEGEADLLGIVWNSSFQYSDSVFVVMLWKGVDFIECGMVRVINDASDGESSGGNNGGFDDEDIF